MKEYIYGFLPGGRFRAEDYDWNELEGLKSQGADGVFLLDTKIGDKHAELGEWCSKAGIDLILGYTDNPKSPDLVRLEKALSITRKLAIGNTRLHEWRDNMGKARDYLQMAKKYDFEWVCTLTQNSILRDIKAKGRLRRQLGQTLCMCLCGHALGAHLFNEPRMVEHSVVRTGRKGLEGSYGVTVETLKRYLDRMNVVSGGGWQKGLELGSRTFARRLGFKGLVIGMPFDLSKADTMLAQA